jgi:adenosylcobyric acid synthase
LLPLSTRIQPSKHLARVRARFAALEGPWAALSGVEVHGYEIHLGETRMLRSGPESIRPVLCANSRGPPLGWQCGPILALYLHGLLENAAVLNALIRASTGPAGIDFDAMADHVEKAFLPGVLESLVECGK